MDRALIFDCDGVLGDTELYGHLPAFNQMWKKLGVPWQWSTEQYGEKLKIGGGEDTCHSSVSARHGLATARGPPRQETIML